MQDRNESSSPLTFQLLPTSRILLRQALRDYGGQVAPAYANLLRQGYGGQEASSRQASRKGQSEKQKAHSLWENRLKFESRILLKIRPHRNLPHYTRKATGLQF